MSDSNHWRCPECREVNGKDFRYSNSHGVGGGMVVSNVTISDGCPKCGAAISGTAILAGNYDCWPPGIWYGPLYVIWFFTWYGGICGDYIAEAFDYSWWLGLLALAGSVIGFALVPIIALAAIAWFWKKISGNAS